MHSPQNRRLIRYFAGLLSAIIAMIYFLIGFRVVSVIDDPSAQIFGIFAGLAYGLGLILLLRFDRRSFWIVGALFQVFVIAMYFNMASQRTPAYEPWGISLRVIQLVLLIALIVLSLRQPEQVQNPLPAA